MLKEMLETPFFFYWPKNKGDVFMLYSLQQRVPQKLIDGGRKAECRTWIEGRYGEGHRPVTKARPGLCKNQQSSGCPSQLRCGQL